MRNSFALAFAVLAALAFNIEWQWHPSQTSTVTFSGPFVGIAVCVIICMVLVYRSFLAVQDLLIAKRYLTTRVSTTFDMLPWIVFLPIAIGYTAGGDNWIFKWGDSVLKLWYFVALLVSVFAFQIYSLIRRIVECARNPE